MKQNSITKTLILVFTLGLIGVLRAQTLSTDSYKIATDGTVYAVSENDDYIAIGGNFTRVGGSTSFGAITDGTTGDVLATNQEPNGTVRVCEPDGEGGFYIGGEFTEVGGVPRAGLAQIDASGNVTSWNPGVVGVPYVIKVSGSTVYMGGAFTEVGGESRNGLAAVTTAGVTTTWNPNVFGNIFAMAIRSGTIVVGGNIISIGGVTRTHLAEIDLSTASVTSWNPVADNWVYTLALDGNTLYVGGRFTNISGTARNRIASYDMTTGNLNAWDPSAAGTVEEIVVYGDDVVVAGMFGGIGGTSNDNLAVIDGSTGTATSFAPNPSFTVTDLALEGDLLYLSGGFVHSSNQPRRMLAAYDLSTESLLDWDPGIDHQNFVFDIAIDGGKVYVGGTFNVIGGTRRARLALFDKETLDLAPIDVEVSGFRLSTVRAVEFVSNALVIGGDFSEVGGQSRTNLASISLSTGLVTSWNLASAEVYALKSNGSSLYMGRYFGASEIDIASGTFTSWNPNFNGHVYDLVLSENTVYATGTFTTANGTSRNYLAEVDQSTGVATSWNPNLNDEANTLAFGGDGNLYVGGEFTSVGGTGRNRLAAIDTTTGVVTDWNTNTGGEVYDLFSTGSILYVGGNFGFTVGVSGESAGALDLVNQVLADWDANLTSGSEVQTIHVTEDEVMLFGYFGTSASDDNSNLILSRANDAPYDITLTDQSIAENAGTSAAVGVLSASDDAGDTHTYQLVSGDGATGNSLFQINGNTLEAKSDLDFETQPSLSVRIRATDNNGYSLEEAFTISVTDVIETGNSITDIIFPGQTGDAVINSKTSSITVFMEPGTNVTSLAPSKLFVSSGATVSPGVGASQNFSSPVSYTVTAENKTAKVWTVTVEFRYGGIYTVQSGGDFTTMDAAITGLNTYGIADDVVLEIGESFGIGEDFERYDGTSNHSLTIRPTDAASSITLATAIGFAFLGTENVIIDGEGEIIFQNGAPGGTVIELWEDATTSAPCKNVEMRNMIIRTEGTGIRAQKVNTVLIENNEIVPNDLRSGVITGITVGDAVGECRNVTIRNNVIDFDEQVVGSGTSVLGISNGWEVSGYNRIYNNVISLKPDNADYVQGISLGPDFDAAEVYHNTIIMDVVNSTTSVNMYGISTITNSGSSMKIKDNLIFMGNSSAGTKYGIYYTTGVVSTIDITDNNIYDDGSATGYYMRIHTTTYDDSNLDVLQDIHPGITASMPVFSDYENLDYSFFGVSLSDPDLRGTFVSLVASDFNGATRSTYAPSKGAFEAPNTIANITSLTFTDQVGDAVIDNESFTITASIDGSADITAISPTIGVSPGASVDPQSGESQNFTSSVVYTVTAEEGNTEDWTVYISLANSIPSEVQLSNASIAENEASGTIVGTLSAIDLDAGDSHTFELVNGSGDDDNDLFNIDGDLLKSAEVLDYEGDNLLSILVRTDDGNGGTFDQQLDIDVTNVVETPTDIGLNSTSIIENNEIDDVVGSLTTADDDNGETYTYTLLDDVSYPDNTSFSIDGSDLVAVEVFDHESKATYTIQIQTDDGNGETYVKEFTIAISDEFEAPTNIFLSASAVDENSSVDTAIGTFSTEDQDAAEVYSYDFATGEGDADNGSFSISGDQLRVGELFDFETKSSYSILVSTSDGNGGSLVKQFDITVNDVSEAPIDVALDNSSISESLAAGTVVGTLSNIDEDAGEVYSYALVTGTGDTDNNSFEILGDELRSAEIFDFETKNSYSVRIQVSDGNGGLHAEPFTINITDVPASITDIGLTSSSVNENGSSGTVVGTLSTIGEEITGSYSYNLVIGTGDDDNGAFTIDSGQLLTTVEFDYESKNTYSILVETNDGEGGTYQKVFAILINDVVEEPTDLALDNTTIEENNSIDAVIGAFTATDEDADEIYTYSLIDEATYPDNTSFDIVDGELLASEMFDYESKNSYLIKVEVNDGTYTYSKEFTIAISDNASEPLIWTGTTWVNGTPGAGSDDVIIDGDYNTADDGLLEVSSLVINSGKTLTVAPDNYLYVVGDITNNGALIVESGADLMSFESGNFSGNDVIIKRNTRYADGRYSFVGTPVQQTSNVTNETVGAHVYTYDETQSYDPNDGLDRWVALSGELVPGVGYTQASQQEIVFEGVPNVGTVNVSGTYTGTYDDATNEENEGWVFVSNPYATAIDVADFLAQTNIEGAVYIWDDNGSHTDRGTNSDYIIANGTVATNTTPAGGQTRFNGSLGSGQGFFVKLADDVDTEITFTPGMRVTGSNSDENFFRSEGVPAYVRVNLINSEGLFKQAIIGRIAGIDDQDVDRSFDAKVFSSKGADMIYTKKGDHALAIQGISYDREAVTLAFNVAEAGVYSVDLDLSNANGEHFFLKDNYTGKVINLSSESYSFTSNAGQFVDRFELLANARVLGVEESKLQVYAHNQTIYFKLANGLDRQVELIDMNGQKLWSKMIKESTEIETNLPAGIYLIMDGERTHKILLK